MLYFSSVGKRTRILRFLPSLDGSMPLYQPYHHRGLLQFWKSSRDEAWYIRHRLSYEVKQVQLLVPYAVPGLYTDDGGFGFVIQKLGDIQMVDVFDMLDDTVYCAGQDEKYLNVGSDEAPSFLALSAMASMWTKAGFNINCVWPSDLLGYVECACYSHRPTPCGSKFVFALPHLFGSFIRPANRRQVTFLEGISVHV